VTQAVIRLEPGITLKVRTRNSEYTIVPREAGEAVIWGHPEYCPGPTAVGGVAGTDGYGFGREEFLAPGMRLTFLVSGRRVSTSRIESVETLTGK
jgi:hypothetical protein